MKKQTLFFAALLFVFSCFAQKSGIRAKAGYTITTDSLRIVTPLISTSTTDSILVYHSADSTIRKFGNYASGTYTPALTNVANVSSSTAYSCQYIRVGAMVTVSGKVSISFTANSNVVSQLGMSLPIASNFANDNECAGVGSSNKQNSSAIRADATNDRAEFYITANASTLTGGETFWFIFTYRII